MQYFTRLLKSALMRLGRLCSPGAQTVETGARVPGLGARTGAAFIMILAAVVSGCQTPGPPPARSEPAIAALLAQFDGAGAADLMELSRRPFVLDREILHLPPDLEMLWSGVAAAELGFAEARIRSIQPVYADSYREFAGTPAMRRHFEKMVVGADASIVDVETPSGERYALLLGGSRRRLPELYGLRGPLEVLASMRGGRVAPASSGDSAVDEPDAGEIPHRVIVTGENDKRELAFPGGRLRFGPYSVAAVSEQQINERRVLKVTPTLGEFRLEVDAIANGGAGAGVDSPAGEPPAITAVELTRFGSSVTVVVDRREQPGTTAGPKSELVVLAASDGATIFASVSGEFAVRTGGRPTHIGAREALEVLPGGRPGDRLRWIGDTISYASYERDRRDRFLSNPVVGLLQLQRVMASYRSEVAAGGRRAAHSGPAARAMRVYMLPRLYVAMKVEYLREFEQPQYLSFAEIYRAVADEYELGIEPRL